MDVRTERRNVSGRGLRRELVLELVHRRPALRMIQVGLKKSTRRRRGKPVCRNQNNVKIRLSDIASSE
eukprot:5536702-Pleurochrysis_carterae.AAC.1